MGLLKVKSALEVSASNGPPKFQAVTQPEVSERRFGECFLRNDVSATSRARLIEEYSNYLKGNFIRFHHDHCKEAAIISLSDVIHN